MILNGEGEKMAIIQNGNQFHLQTKNTSYILGIYQDKYPVHFYWGERLEPDISLEYQAESVSVDRASCFARQLVEGKWVFEPDLKKEFSAVGKGDYRIPTVHARYADGSTVSDLSYEGFRITEGKKELEGLPSLYVFEGDRAQTLELFLKDPDTGLKAALSYTVLEDYDVITRSIRYVNDGPSDPQSASMSGEGGSDIHLLSAMSMTVDLPAAPMQYIQFPGDWARERSVECCDVKHGIASVSSSRGYSSHCNNPFLILKEPSTTEKQGQAYGLALVYSGNFAIQIEKAPVGTIRVAAGLDSFDLDWTLKPGESFQTPETVLAYSAQGMNRLSQIYHRVYRERLMDQRYLHASRPIVINNYEGTGSDFTEQQLIDIIRVGGEVGAEMFVLDSGWYGRYGNGNSCGDWYVNEEKLPHGLKYLAEEAKACGMQMGLWFEPEMMTVKSDLYREHPDWCLHVKGRESAPIYGRVVLDLSRPEVCEYIIGSVGRQIEEVGLTYIKWDCNRYFTETADQMQAHKYMLGFYHVLKTLTTKYPGVLFEGCSGGGGRFDAGMLRYMPQTWTSDMTKPEERLCIQHGTSYGYPVVSMASHIGQIEVGKNARNPYLEFSALVAMGGNFGLEMDLSLLSETEKAQVKGYVETYKRLRHIICQGDFYRLESPFDGPYTTWEYVSRDRSEAVLLAFQTRNGKNGEQHMVWLEGLDEKKCYQWKGRIYTGQELMKVGIFMKQPDDWHGEELLYFKAV